MGDRPQIDQIRLSELDEDIQFLHSFGIGLPTLQQAQRRSKRFSVPAAQALIASGNISETDYFNCVAFELGVEFVERVPNNATPFFKTPDPKTLSRMAHMVLADTIDQRSGERLVYIAPDCKNLSQLKELIIRCPNLAKRLRVTTFQENLRSLTQRGEPSLLRTAKNRLLERFPNFSALRVITVRQALVLLISLQILALLTISLSSFVTLVLHLIASLFYIGCISLRLAAVATFKKPTETMITTNGAASDESLPVYSVVAAIYNEAAQVDGLVDALLSLNWPRERLEIKLVCEGDDKETISAVNRALARVKCNFITLVEVPPSLPRTKPKALNFALPLCTGRMLVIYDAEDRPNPDQLKEAYVTFLKKGPELGCIQAPLTIHNNTESWFSKLFAIEYSSLFDGLLPMLVRANAPIPLGGTSNHFKRSTLEQVGAWDPYNVTEDADLGIRLARNGYQIQTITTATEEEAPVHFSVWLKQRTRWYKGWYQTWLVHMRHPIALSQDLGVKGTLIFHMMITGMIVSSLVHPLLLLFVLVRAYEISQHGFFTTVVKPLFLLDLATIILGYCALAALAWQTLSVRNLTHLRSALWGIPLYWLLLSLASWRAAWHLILKPHEWEKTPHRLSSHVSNPLHSR